MTIDPVTPHPAWTTLGVMRSSSYARRSWGAVLVAALILGMPGLRIAEARAEEPTVRAVLFYSPTCPHCHAVIEGHMPGWFEENGGIPQIFYDPSLPSDGVSFYLITNGTLEILLVDVALDSGWALFQAATEALDIDSNGVPRLVAGDEVMIGSAEIPERFPEIVSAAIEAGGLEWPAIPGMAAAVKATGGEAPATTTTEPTVTTSTGGTAPVTTTTEPTTVTTSGGAVPPVLPDRSMWDRFRQDVVGNTLSVVVLLAMLAALFAAARQWVGAPRRPRLGWMVPVLALTGMAVAIYMARVEIGGEAAVCGPVGDCNAVQQSPYARLFGAIPVGVLGIVGYGLVLVAWSVARFARRPAADWSALALLAGGLIGTIFSLYLTFLEPFVIGATCLWCITSAIVVTLLMLLVVRDARGAADRLGLRRPWGGSAA